MKLKYEFKSIVAETLLIPLYMRAKESRRELIPEQPDNVYIAASLLETDWMDDLRRKHPEAEFIFIVEGVLMYFYEKGGGTDVLLREASKILPASCGKPFRGR